MINNKFIFTTHSFQKWDLRFPQLLRKHEISNLVYCNDEEIGYLKNSKSYKKIKKGKRQYFNFYKSKNDVFFITEAKYQNKRLGYANVVITVMDINEENRALSDAEFNKEMILADYEMRNRVIPTLTETKKKKTKKKKNKEQTFVHEKDSYMGLLECNINLLNKKNYFSKKIDLNLFEKDKAFINQDLFKKIKKTVEMVHAHNATINAYLNKKKCEKPDEETLKKIQHYHLAIFCKRPNLIKNICSDDFDWSLIQNDDLNYIYEETLEQCMDLNIRCIDDLAIIKKVKRSYNFTDMAVFLNFIEKSKFSNESIDSKKEYLAETLFNHLIHIMDNITLYSNRLNRSGMIEQIRNVNYLISYFSINEDEEKLKRLHAIHHFYDLFAKQMVNKEVLLDSVLERFGI